VAEEEAGERRRWPAGVETEPERVGFSQGEGILKARGLE
jgi:hypothetical protein